MGLYRWNGKDYDSWEALIAAMQGGGIAVAAREDTSASLERIEKFLANPGSIVDQIYDALAGADGALQEHEMKGLVKVLTSQIGIDPSFFENVDKMFWRFDYDGSGHLDRNETRKLIKFLLQEQQRLLKPKAPGMELCQLEMRNLRQDFSLGKKLGQGGQGAVYLAKERKSGTDRVVKFYGKQACSVEDIKDEFELLKILDHPNIARICEAFQDYENIYVISEPYTGGDLTTLVQKATDNGVKITHKWLGFVFLQIIEGIRYLHSHKTMHCDLKEPNVMIATDNAWRKPPVMLIDFGMAKNYSGTRFGGTPGYMPPEFWTHDMWTPKGDMFALAVTFWGIYNGQPGQGGPFARPQIPGWQGIQAFQLTAQATCQEPMNCSQFPAGLQEIVQAMASKDFRQRPTAKDVCNSAYFQKLSDYEEGQPIDEKLVRGLVKAAEQNVAQNMVALLIAEQRNLGQMKTLNNLFRQLDQSDNGKITADDARQALKQVGLGDIAQKVVDSFGGDGEIMYTEFMAKMIVAQEGFTKSSLAEAFKSMDKDGSGMLSRDEIKEVLTHKNMESITDERSVDSLMELMDLNGDGVISFSEFAAVMIGKPPRAQSRFSQGETVEYRSASLGKWIPAKIVSVSAHGRVQIDVKPGAWFDADLQSSSLRAKWTEGEAAEYNSTSQGKWIPCDIVAVDGGRVQIDVKPGAWLDAQSDSLRKSGQGGYKQ
jgi:calcium-dependent protein kinase